MNKEGIIRSILRLFRNLIVIYFVNENKNWSNGEIIFQVNKVLLLTLWYLNLYGSNCQNDMCSPTKQIA